MKQKIFLFCSWAIWTFLVVACQSQPATPTPRSVDSSTPVVIPEKTASQTTNVDSKIILDSLNSLPPDDIIEEVGYFSGAGPGNEWPEEDPNAPLLIMQNDDTELHFYRFQPNEGVRLLVYNQEGIGAGFVGWKSVRVNGNGELVILLSEMGKNYVAIGDQSGVVVCKDSDGSNSEFGKQIGDVYCSGALKPLGFIVGENIEIIVDELTVENLSQQYSEQSKNIKLSRGQQLYMLPVNPRCRNGTFWWTAECVDGSCVVWVPESGLNGYNFQLITYAPPTSTPIPSLPVYYPLSNCAPSRIYVGDVVRLEQGTDYVTIRNTPDTNPKDNKIGQIKGNERAKVIGGPVCNYGWLLWKIERISDGLVGWVPETDEKEFWLMPVK
jgi:hypothetical protein